MNKPKIFLITLMLGFVILPQVAAIGITPGRVTVDFESNLEKEVTFSIVNTESKDMRVALSVQGDLAEYVQVTQDVIVFSEEDAQKEFTYTVRLPDELPPGLNTANIVATELPDGIDNQGTILQATVSVITQLFVHVSFAGKFIETTIDIVPKDNEGVVNFYIPIISRGEQTINEVTADIDIYREDSRITTIRTDSIQDVAFGDRRELTARWEPDGEIGTYEAIAKITYDDRETIVAKEFVVGGLDLNVLGISVNDFTLGDVARIRILLQNRLSKTIQKAHAELGVFDSNLQTVADLTSEDYVIEPNQNAEMTIFWNTEDVDSGIYSSELDITYDNAIINKKFKVDVGESSMTFSGIGLVVSGDGGPNTRISTTTLLIIVIVVLVLGNLVWLLYYLRNKKTKKSKK